MGKIIFFAFAIFWVVFVTLDYANKHPFYYYALQFFKYQELIVSQIIIVAIIYAAHKLSIFKKLEFITNKAAFLIPLIIIELGLVSFYSLEYAGMQYHVFYLQEFILRNIFPLIFLIAFSISAFLYGDLILAKKKDWIVKLGAGIMVITFTMFLLAAIKQLKLIPLIVLLVLPFIINYKSVFPTIKETVLASSKLKNLNLIGCVCLVFIIFFNAINFSSCQVPFPLGFDSRNFYSNLSVLLSSQGQLVEGFRPYSWELLMSMGHILFSKVEYVLSISYYGFFLSLVVIYKIADKYLKLNINQILFIFLWLSITPAIANELRVELKGDFGMLFYQLLSIYLCLKLFVSKSFLRYFDEKTSAIKNRNLILQIALLGLFMGFANSIKLTNLFLFFSIIILMVWICGKRIHLFSILFLTLGVFILFKFDDLSGLRNAHLSVNIIKYLLVLIGLGLTIYSFTILKTRTIKIATVLVVFGLASLIPMTPWVVKNLAETKSLSVNELINGKTPGPNIGAYEIIQNYQNRKNGG